MTSLMFSYSRVPGPQLTSHLRASPVSTWGGNRGILQRHTLRHTRRNFINATLAEPLVEKADHVRLFDEQKPLLLHPEVSGQVEPGVGAVLAASCTVSDKILSGLSVVPPTFAYQDIAPIAQGFRFAPAALLDAGVRPKDISKIVFPLKYGMAPGDLSARQVSALRDALITEQLARDLGLGYLVAVDRLDSNMVDRLRQFLEPPDAALLPAESQPLVFVELDKRHPTSAWTLYGVLLKHKGLGLNLELGVAGAYLQGAWSSPSERPPDGVSITFNTVLDAAIRGDLIAVQMLANCYCRDEGLNDMDG